MHRCRRASDLRRWALVLGVGIGSAVSLDAVQAQELCGGVEYPFPYTDVSAVGAAFCPGIMEAYVTGVSKGTSSTTFSPNNTVTRVQMTTFLQRSLDQGLARTGRRAALNQWWVPQNIASMQTITVTGNPLLCAADGADIWVSIGSSGVARVEANTGRVLGTWTGATSAVGVIPAAGRVFVTDFSSPGVLYAIDPTLAPGALANVATLPNLASGIAFDGTNLWTANLSGSVSKITPQSPYTVTTPTTVFDSPLGILYDGAHIWVTDNGAGTLIELDSAGNMLQTVATGAGAGYPVFDGANIWVPNFNANSLTVVQASTGNVVAQISADANNKLSNPEGATFDGERILVTNNGTGSVTLFKAADLSLIANIPTASAHPWSTCSDGINFWVPLLASGNLLRL
jgi:DNA-binding beta-propeller fold protein YncE